jgi:hypothetical protein
MGLATQDWGKSEEKWSGTGKCVPNQPQPSIQKVGTGKDFSSLDREQLKGM